MTINIYYYIAGLNKLINMNVQIQGDNLVITIPIPKNAKALKESKTGKSLQVASSNGNMPTGAKVDGKEIILGLNAYIKKD